MCTQYNHSNLDQIKVFTDTFDTKMNKVNCHFCSIQNIFIFNILIQNPQEKFFLQNNKCIWQYISHDYYQWRSTMSVFFRIHSKMNFPYSIPQREIVKGGSADVKPIDFLSTSVREGSSNLRHLNIWRVNGHYTVLYWQQYSRLEAQGDLFDVLKLMWQCINALAGQCRMSLQLRGKIQGSQGERRWNRDYETQKIVKK